MDMSGEYRIPAPRDTVWAGLNDPEILKASIPGCQSLDKLSDTEMTAKVVAKIGPVKATFTGAVTLSNLNPPESYTISGEGKGGAAGFAKGGADVSLREEGAGTVLTYVAKAQVGGKLAQIGSRLVDSAAKKMADDFFRAFAEKVGGAPAEAAASPLVGPEGEQVGPAAPAVDRLPGEPPPATAPIAGVETSEGEDRAAESVVFAEAAEERLEEAAGRGFLGGPMVWGLIALAIVILLLVILT